MNIAQDTHGMDGEPLDRDSFDAALNPGIREEMAHGYASLRTTEATALGLFLDENGKTRPDLFEWRDCPVCASPPGPDHLLVQRHGLIYVTCPVCGLTYTRQVLTDEGEKVLYSDFSPFNSHYWSFRASPAYRRLETAKARYILGRARPHVGEGRPGGARLLDIGSSNGTVMRAAAGLGWRPQGIEANRTYVAACQDEGLDVMPGFFPDCLSGQATGYDIITMLDVLEHTRDPCGFLNAVRRALVPGGLAVVQVPNLESLAIRVAGAAHNNFSIGHWSFFTCRSLDMVMTRCGFARLGEETIISEIDKIAAAPADTVRAVFEQLTGEPPGDIHLLSAERLHSEKLGYKILALYRAAI
jgi:2-polyprenyl-3-methyl-5-hydroxy-6-metoxy-1,4-benzoquinol methylase